MPARNAGNFPCAYGTVPVHTSCSGSLPGPSQASSFHLCLLVPTPVLLVDVFSGVRIGEERRNVLTGGRQLLARWEYRVKCIFLSRVFLYFFQFCSVCFAVLRPVFAVLSSSFLSPRSPFPRILVRLLARSPYRLWLLFWPPRARNGKTERNSFPSGVSRRTGPVSSRRQFIAPSSRATLSVLSGG